MRRPLDWYQSYSSLRPVLDPSYLASATNPAPFTGAGELRIGAHAAASPSTRRIDGTQFRSELVTAACAAQNRPAAVANPAKEHTRALILGCGNSTFGFEMLQDGYKQIVNVDFSSVVIDQMKRKREQWFGNDVDQNSCEGSGEEKQSLQFHCVDITKGLPFDDESFDLVICKGTMDAILTSGTGDIRNVIAETARVLRRGIGMLVIVSHGNEDQRLMYLEHPYTSDLLWYWETVKCLRFPRGVPSAAKK
jgi:SAM-dependent methyltransferase